MNILDSPLNKAGLVQVTRSATDRKALMHALHMTPCSWQVYIHTSKNVLIKVRHLARHPGALCRPHARTAGAAHTFR